MRIKAHFSSCLVPTRRMQLHAIYIYIYIHYLAEQLKDDIVFKDRVHSSRKLCLHCTKAAVARALFFFLFLQVNK